MPSSRELFAQLACAVGPEVEEDRRVVAGSRRGAPVDHGREDELVGDAGVVARLHGVQRVGVVRPGSADDRVQRELGAIPALVAVHRVVAAGNRRDAVERELGEIVDRRVRRDVAAVGESMDPRLLRGELQQRLHVRDVRVHAAVRDEPEQMHVLPALERSDQVRIGEEAAL